MHGLDGIILTEHDFDSEIILMIVDLMELRMTGISLLQQGGERIIIGEIRRMPIMIFQKLMPGFSIEVSIQKLSTAPSILKMSVMDIILAPLLIVPMNSLHQFVQHSIFS